MSSTRPVPSAQTPIFLANFVVSDTSPERLSAALSSAEKLFRQCKSHDSSEAMLSSCCSLIATDQPWSPDFNFDVLAHPLIQASSTS